MSCCAAQSAPSESRQCVVDHGSALKGTWVRQTKTSKPHRRPTGFDYPGGSISWGVSMIELEPVDNEQAIRTLLGDTDPVRRSRAHYLLGRSALDRSDLLTARDHFSEAADLDPTDERPRSELATLTAVPAQKTWGQRVAQFLRGES